MLTINVEIFIFLKLLFECWINSYNSVNTSLSTMTHEGLWILVIGNFSEQVYIYVGFDVRFMDV